ncbi:MAG: hypothetical protein K2X29_06395 [Candidatus Obscuribacterales bacterium]|nr:hypothetical protein [Candidatus Obscuribacterales bacterium]
MSSNVNVRTKLLRILTSALLLGQLLCTAQAAPLKGGVQMDHHPGASMRISRPVQTPRFTYNQGSMDSAQPPLAGRAQDSGNPLRGVLNDSDFMKGKPVTANLDEEVQSREMILAWERWHKQLSGAIYDRWSDVARYPGVATVKITVSKNHNITANILNSTGTPAFNSGLMASIESLNGNPGLSFPSGSRRQVVTYQADYVAGRNVNPGYTWVKNDYERVREN